MRSKSETAATAITPNTGDILAERDVHEGIGTVLPTIRYICEDMRGDTVMPWPDLTDALHWWITFLVVVGAVLGLIAILVALTAPAEGKEARRA